MYADSAEQTLIAELRQVFMASEECGALINAFKGAVWNDKIIGKEERLDESGESLQNIIDLSKNYTAQSLVMREKTASGEIFFKAHCR